MKSNPARLQRWWLPRRSLRVTAPGPRGFIVFLIILGLFYVSLDWLRRDPKFSSSIVLNSVLHLVLSQGIIDVSPEEVFQAGAHGLTAVLDPFSAYMGPAELALFEEETEGEYVGIGIEIKVSPQAIIIIKVFPQSPAAEAGLVPGDEIVSIDGQVTAGFSLLRAVELMRGPEGSEVEVSVRSLDSEPRILTLKRRAVTISPFPLYGVSQSGAAYVRWTDFTEGSSDRLAAILEGITVEQPAGLVLDLRANPGGILEEAVSAAGLFLPADQLVCKLVSRRQRESLEFRTAPSLARYADPVVIVIDEGSASASEILAAALQEKGRAVIVGRKSFGKGWVQNLFELPDGGAIRLSTARYYTPDGQTFGQNHWKKSGDSATTDSSWFIADGITPDTTIESVPIGRWQQVLAARGAFADFCMQYAAEWPADDLIEVFKQWCDSVGFGSVGLGRQVALDLRMMIGASELASDQTHMGGALAKLEEASLADSELLFERERSQLLMRLWEQRLLVTARPDERELEQYIDSDPDLATARDLLEEADRYDRFTSLHVAQLKADSDP